MASRPRTEYVPEIDDAYRFDPQTTLAILAGFEHNRRVMVQGYHGTGKSTHIEQVAARLNWPMMRVNLDSHVSRIDMVGKDAIVLKDGSRSPNSAKASCHGPFSARWRSRSTNTMPAVRT
jgi:cobaltochelatase CobS